MKQIRLWAVLVGSSLVLSACSGLSLPSWVSKKAEKQPFWRQLGTDGVTKAKYAVDLNSKQRKGNMVQFNSKIAYPQAVQAPAKLALPNFNSMVNQWEIDCINKTYRLMKTDFVGSNGEVVHQQTFPNTEAKYIGAPETAAAMQYKLMCTGS